MGIHIPHKVVKLLERLGHEAVHVNQILDKWHTADAAIARYADAEGFIVITKDADFRHSFMVKGTPQKVLRIRLGNLPNAQLLKLLEAHLPALEAYFKQSCLVELTDMRLIVYDA